MDVKRAIQERRAYRSLSPMDITQSMVDDLAESARLAPSCFNNQPWRYVFVYDPQLLEKVGSVLSPGNRWAHYASMIIAVFSRKEYDCVIRGREYYLFDVGLATGFLILRATELGLVAHPIAGYDEEGVKEVLGIPDDMTVINLVIVGKHSEAISSVLSDRQAEAERIRPVRLPLTKIVHIDRFDQSVDEIEDVEMTTR